MSKIPLPRVVKRPLVAVWNTSHRLSRRAFEYGSALSHCRVEHCAVCGRTRPMLCRRVIPNRLIELWGLSPSQAAAFDRRESSDCSACGAKLRARRIAEVLLELYPTGARSLHDWSMSAPIRALRIAEINRIDGVHEALADLPGFRPSDFTPGVEPGTSVRGARCEDFTRLTYPDASFDLVLTSETIEHVPDLAKALAECRRVLVPGGFHVFTAPVSPDVAKTFPRARLNAEGAAEHLAPVIAHPGGDWGYPVFTELGLDLPKVLERAGFETEVRFGPVRDDDLAQVYVCRKP